jgi:hypothetical protein
MNKKTFKNRKTINSNKQAKGRHDIRLTRQLAE